ncbi:hypothetical protein [Pantoea sp.]|uniref:hypothetical protein n=1 Tax=Pantoea sp. TaxID=69393 RepID=UPI0031D1EB18
METKFLSDGRKVVIVGQLNNTETIVQEVFVTQAGDELPGGERFVVKSLHDQPVESWLSRETVKHEKALADAKSKVEGINKEIDDLRNKLSFWKGMVKQVAAFAKHINDANLDHFADVLTGQVKYAVSRGYGLPEIEKFEDYMSSIDNYYGRKEFKGIKCISVLGSTDGNIALTVSVYSDGSGGSNQVEFYKTIEEARKRVKQIALEMLNGNGLSLDAVRKCSSMGIIFSKDELQQVRDRLFVASEKSLAHHQEQFDKQVVQINSNKQAIEQMLNEAIN